MKKRDQRTRKGNWKAGSVCLLLLLSLAVSGCGRNGGKQQGSNLDQGSLEKNSVVMKVGDASVRYGEVRAYCYLLKCQYEGNFGKKLWKYPLGANSSIGDEAKQEIVNVITQLKIISAAAKEEKVSLTAEEKDSAMQAASELMEKAADKDIRGYFLDQQQLTEIYEENILARKMFYIATAEVPTDIPEEEARQIAVDYIQVMTDGTDRNGRQISMDDKEKAQALKRAQRLAREAASAEDFLSFAQSNTDAPTAEITTGRDGDVLEKAALEAALSLKTGETSGVVKGEQGYYILYCQEDNAEEATYQRKEEIIQERQTNMFMDKYSQWMKDKAVNISESFWDEFAI